MRPSIAARSFWSFSTSKKPPQFAGTRFQILGIGDGDFCWHAQKNNSIPRESQKGGPLSVRVARFWFRGARGLETENCFALFHQIETIARNRFQIGCISLEQIDLAGLMCEQILLLVYLLLQIIDLGTALR